ncbi:hypothetical protein ACPZRF_20820, partial [Alkalicoccus sp. WONF2802]
KLLDELFTVHDGYYNYSIKSINTITTVGVDIKHQKSRVAVTHTAIKLREARHSAMDRRNPVPWMASF